MAKPSVLTLVLLSAAPTVWDDAGRLVGRAAIPSTDPAMDALHKAAKAFAASPSGKLDLVICGPEDATYASAAMLAEAVQAKLRRTEDLANVDLGLWDGSLKNELETRCPSTFRAWQEQPDRIRPPEGESLADAADRAVAAIRRAAEKTRLAHPRMGVCVRPMLWAALLARLGHEPWSAYWGLADRKGEMRCIEHAFADLIPQPLATPA